jgi:hypothetical protein
MYHVTASVNRESISKYGLDWARMADARGFTDRRTPEVPAIFLFSEDELSYFTRNILVPSDLWAVRIEGLDLDVGPNDSFISREPIAKDRVRLAQTDLEPDPRAAGR